MSLTGTTRGKTLSSNRPSINFGSYPDVWYKFTATSRIHRVTTYHSSTDGASQQLIVGVVGDCNTPQFSTLNYIYANFYTSRTSSFDTYGLVPGNTYYVYVAGQNVDFTICTEAKTESPIPSNDAQSGAITLSTAPIGSGCGTIISGSTVGATNQFNQYGGVQKPDVWYKFTAVSNRHKYKLTNIRSLTGTNYGDFGVTISPNGGGYNYGYNYIPFNALRTFYNSTNQTIGQNYYVQIGGVGMGFDLCTEAIAWTPAAANDDANNATSLSDINNCPNRTTFGSNDGIVWYKFVATQATHTLTINNTKDQDGVAQTSLSGVLYKGNSLQQVSNLSMTNYTYPYTGNFTQTLNSLTVGETYYISVCGGCGGISTTLYLTYNICVDIPTLLSIELLSFKAQNTEGGNLLTWQTANEINTSHFDIERSTDGKIFDKIGELKAQNKAAHYNYIDKSIINSTVYYRLKINDLDGTINYSNIVSITNKNKGLIIKVFPNPFNDNFNVAISTEKKAELTIDLIDILGRLVHHSTVNTEGSLQVSISTKDLPSGAYFLKISDGQSVLQQKLIKSK